MTLRREELIEHLRAFFADEPSVREISMFGGRSFMVHDKMVACIRNDGALLVRVHPDRDDELSGLPGVARATMGAGRNMGPGWISVAVESLTNDERLSLWLGIAMEYNQAGV